MKGSIASLFHMFNHSVKLLSVTLSCRRRLRIHAILLRQPRTHALVFLVKLTLVHRKVHLGVRVIDRSHYNRLVLSVLNSWLVPDFDV